MKTQSLSQQFLFRILTTSILCILGAAAVASASIPAGYSKYYIPGDEEQLLRVFRQFGAGGNSTHTIITVTAGSADTTIYYDHWEDGYDFDPADPTTADETVVLANRGDFHTFESSGIPANPRGTAQYYDGRDYMYVAGGTVTVTRASWIEAIGPVQSVSWEVYPVKPQLTTYILPFGEDLSGAPKNLPDFSRVFALLQATADGTVVTVDLDGDGIADKLDQNRDGDCSDPGDTSNILLDAGDVFLLDDAGGAGGYQGSLCPGDNLNTGAVISGADTLQVQYVIGSTVHGNYEIRGLSAFPRGFWDDEYYAPVDGAAGADTDIFLHNPHASPLRIDYQTASASGFFVINPNDTVSFQAETGGYVPQNSGVYFKGSDVFWGVSSVDTNSRTSDWGYSLVPASLLKNEHFMGWAPSSFPVTVGDYDDSGIFITPAQDNTTVFVDYDADGTPDNTYTLDRLVSQYVFDNFDGDLSGANIWATGPYALAYGQNPDLAPPASPAIDVGYTAIPGVDLIDLVLQVDQSANPILVPTAAGAQSTYTLTVDSYAYSVDGLSMTDTLPAGWQYVLGTTQITYADMTTGTTDPVISGGGLVLTWSGLGAMAGNQQVTITFTARTTKSFTAGAITRNVVEATGTRTVNTVTQTFTTSDFIFNSYGELALTKTTGGIDPLYPGDRFTYTVTVTNPASASAPLTGIAVYDPLPAGLDYVAASSRVTSPQPRYFLDTFTDGTYTNNADNSPGSMSWATDWFDSQDNDPNAKSIRIVSDAGDNRLRMANDGRRAMRKADLSSGTTAILSFDARRVNLKSGQHIAVEVCDSIAFGRNNETCGGGGWVEITRFNGPGTDAAYATYSYDLAAWLATPNSANFAVRFNSPSGQGMKNANKVFFDNVRIDLGTTTVVIPAHDPPDFLSVNDGYILQPGQSLTLTYDVTVNDPLANGIGAIINTASANSNEIPLPVNAQASNIVVNPTMLSATVGDRVWLDANGDAVQNIGEQGLPNVQVVLKDRFGTPIATTATDGNGYYGFTNILPGTGYYVEVSGGAPAGLSQSAPGGHSDNRTGSFDLVAAQSYTGADLGYAPAAGTATFGDIVWSDGNGNGVRDAGEPGLGGITVKIFLDTGDGSFDPTVDTLISTTLTAADGSYLLTGITPAGSKDYFIWVDETQAALSAYTATTGTSPLNSNVNVGDVLLNNDIGFLPADGAGFSIQDRVWLDTDGDGSDTAESGIAGVSVDLLDASLNVLAATTSDANGYFTFIGVPASANYTIRVTDTAAVLANYYGTTAAALSGDQTVTNLSADVTGAHFGYNLTSSIGDLIFNDLNGSGGPDSGEPGIGGVSVELWADNDGDGTVSGGDTRVSTLTSAADGSYLFTGLADGDYVINIPTPLAGYSSTTGGNFQATTLAGGSNDLTIDFGYQAITPRSASGKIWNDTNGDGVIDPGEPIISGVTVELLQGGAVIGSTTSDAAGVYTFTDVAPGIYTIVLTDTGSVLTGFTGTYEKTGGTAGPFDGQESIDLTGGDLSDIHFGFYKPVPTLAVIADFTAFNDSGEMVIEWQTSSESGTVGFYLQRLDASSHRYVKVNRHILPGLLDAPQGGTYRYIDKSVTPSTQTYRLVEIEIRGKTRKHGPYRVTPITRASMPSMFTNADGSGLSPERSAAGIENASGVYFSKPHGRKRVLSKAARRWLRKHTRRRHGRYAAGLKIAVHQNGLYRIPADVIESSFNMPWTAALRHSCKHLRLAGQGRPVRAWCREEGLYFYGEAIDSIYADQNMYRLTRQRSALNRMAISGAPLSGALTLQPDPGRTFVDTLHFEENNWPLTALFDNPNADYWFWDYVFAGFGAKTFPFTVNGAIPDGVATLTVRFQGATDSSAPDDHHAIVRLNGSDIGEVTWDGTGAPSQSFEIASSMLNNGANTLEITGVLNQGVPYSLFYINSFDVTYQRQYLAGNDVLFCRGDDNAIVTADNFNSPDILVLDISEPSQPTKLNRIDIEDAAGTYQATFVPASPHAQYLVTTWDAALSASDTYVDNPSTLTNRDNEADELIITTEGLAGAARKLADYRSQSGLQTRVVDIEDIYDEFNFGIASPLAIRSFLQYAYIMWRVPPRYILIAGNGTYDYKDNQGYGDNLVPPVMIGTDNGLVASDNFLADVLYNDGVPEMSIGRIPAATPDELTAFIDKIINYESAPTAPWMRDIVMTADNPDDGGPFSVDSDTLAALVPNTYRVSKIYLSGSNLAQARGLLGDALNQGALFVNYIGHAGLDRLTEEGLLISDDAAMLTNSERLPVLTAMTCVAGRFEIPGFTTLGKNLLFHANGGIIALWGATGYSYNQLAVNLDAGLFNDVFNGGQRVIGDAVRQALVMQYNAMGGYQEILDLYNLLGDPAMILH